MAQGPRGEFMGVHLDKGLQRMQLLANTDYDKFEGFASELKKALRSVKVREKNDADTQVRVTKEKSGWVLALALAIIGLGGSFMGSQLLVAMREAPELVIELPPSKDGLAEIQSSDVIVAWTYRQPHAISPPTVDNQTEAIVDVRRSDGTVLIANGARRGTVELKGLTEGSYSIRIAAAGASKSLLLQIKPKPVLVPPEGQNLLNR